MSEREEALSGAPWAPLDDDAIDRLAWDTELDRAADALGESGGDEPAAIDALFL